jgi:hypothetical protein
MARKGKKHKDKRTTPTVCVYCGELAICTDEHVIPQCLFPEGQQPPKSDFVIVPVCSPCNERKARDDSYIRDWLATDLASDGSPVAEAVRPTVYRSAKKNWSDHSRTAAMHARMQDVHTPSGIYVGRFVAVPIEGKRVNRFFRWVIRGLYWKKFGSRIPDNYVFEVGRLPAERFNAQFQTMMGFGGNGPYAVGERVFRCIFIYADENHFITQWLMWFYDSIFITVDTGPPEWFHEMEQLQKQQQGASPLLIEPLP